MAAKFYCQFCGKGLHIQQWDFEVLQENTSACALICNDCCTFKFEGDCGTCIQRCAVLRAVILERFPEYTNDMVVLPLDSTLELTEEIAPPDDYEEVDYVDDYPPEPYDEDDEY